MPSFTVVNIKQYEGAPNINLAYLPGSDVVYIENCREWAPAPIKLANWPEVRKQMDKFYEEWSNKS